MRLLATRVAVTLGCLLLAIAALGLMVDGRSPYGLEQAWLYVPVDRTPSDQRPVETSAPD